MLSGSVYVDMSGRDLGGYVEALQRVVRGQVARPPGYPICLVRHASAPGGHASAYLIWRWHTDIKPQGGASQGTTAVMTGAQPNAL